MLNIERPAFTKGATTAAVLTAAGALATFGLQYLLAAQLGAEEYGQFAFAHAWLLVGATVSTFGFESASLRFIPGYLVHKRFEAILTMVRFARRAVALAGVGFTLLSITVATIFVGLLPPGAGVPVVIGAAIVPFLASVRLNSAFNRAVGSVIGALYAELLLVPAGFLCLWIVSTAAGLERTARSAAIVLLVGTVTASVVVAFQASRRLRALCGKLSGGKEDGYERCNWLRSAVPLMVNGLAQMCIMRIPVLLCGAMLGAREAGVMALGLAVASIVTFVQRATDVQIAPYLAHLHAQGDRSALGTAFQRVTAVNGSFAIFAAVAAIGMGHALERHLGSDYAGLATVTGILAIGFGVNTCLGPSGYLMSMTGRETLLMKIMLGNCLFVAVGQLVGVLTAGLWGSALALALALAAWQGVIVRQNWRALGVLPWGPWRLRRAGDLSGLTALPPVGSPASSRSFGARSWWSGFGRFTWHAGHRFSRNKRARQFSDISSGS